LCRPLEPRTNGHTCITTSHANVTRASYDNYVSVLFINATSLAKPGAVQLLKTELTQGNYGIALIVETWFTEQHIDSVISVSNYTLFRRDRLNRKGGGVCAYVRNDITCCYCQPVVHKPNASCTDNLEILWLECNYVGITYYIACCYHPPRPRYDNSAFIEALSADIDAINLRHGHAIIIIAGDFNQLNTEFLVTDYGLIQTVDQPTHGDNFLDKVFVNLPDVFTATVFKSVIKTKHLAIVLSSATAAAPQLQATRRKIRLYDLRCHHIDKLRYYLGVCDWSDLLSSNDVSFIYDQFVIRLTQLMKFCVPIKTVTLGYKDPNFVTPLVKLLLRKRYRLRRQGRNNEASQLAMQINDMIAHNRQNNLAKLVDAGSKQLWAAVRKTAGQSHSNTNLHQHSPDNMNAFFANVATNTSYDCRAVMQYFSTGADTTGCALPN